MRKIWAAVAALAFVCACAPQIKNTWIRADGQRGMGNPALAQQFEMDKTICEGEMQKANLAGSAACYGLANCVGVAVARDQSMGVVGKGCMAQRGYVLVPEDQAEAKAAELRLIAASQQPPAPQQSVRR